MAESKDIEINQFPIVSSLSNKDYIVVSLDDGSQGRIKTSDLASVVAAVVFGPLSKLGQKNIAIGPKSYIQFKVNKWSVFSIYDTTLTDESGLFLMSGNNIETIKESRAVSSGWITLSFSSTAQHEGIITVTNNKDFACNFYYHVFA